MNIVVAVRRKIDEAKLSVQATLFNATLPQLLTGIEVEYNNAVCILYEV